MEVYMQNNNSNSTNQKRQPMKKKSSYSNAGSSYKDEKERDGINYDFDWNTEYGDGDIPDIDEP